VGLENLRFTSEIFDDGTKHKVCLVESLSYVRIYTDIFSQRPGNMDSVLGIQYDGGGASKDEASVGLG
jgi:hypothetical protein